MNIRVITKQEIPATLTNLKKIFKDQQGPPFIREHTKEEIAEKLVRDGYKVVSAFENGGEIATVILKDGKIYALGVKDYARGRGVGSTLLSEAVKGPCSVNCLKETVPFYLKNGFVIEEETPAYTRMKKR